jgi:adenylosuccinate lyase
VSILPLDSGRYGTVEMRKIFEEEERLQRMLDVEGALAWAQAELGVIPEKNATEIMSKASTRYVTVEDVKDIEKSMKHEVMAMVDVLSKACGDSGLYIHLGATSSDILDTGMALQVKAALDKVEKELDSLENILLESVEKYERVVMIGRTHGQHALPITLGLKFSVWLREISRHIERLSQTRKRILVGKMTGAVGTQAGLGPKGLDIQKLVMKRLGLGIPEVTTQILQRDRHAELVCLLAIIASTLDKFSIEIRNLQRPEIAEVSEAFDVKKQIGSSTMPHKRNPVTCEKVCGLAKIMRSLVTPALEDVPTWHERDLTQSSCERFIIPESFIILDEMLTSTNNVLHNLHVDKERMRSNIELTQGRALSESLMIKLTMKGMARQDAYKIAHSLAMKSEDAKAPFRDLLITDQTVRKYLNENEIDAALNPENYLGTTYKQIEGALKKTRLERKRRGLLD